MQQARNAADLETEVRRLRVRLMTLTVDQWEAVGGGEESRTRRTCAADALRALCALTQPPPDAPPVWEAAPAELPARLMALFEACQPRRGASERATREALAVAQGLRRSLA